MSLLTNYIQDPLSILDYGQDWTSWLATGETLTGTPTISIALVPSTTPPSGGTAMTASAGPSIVGNIVTFWLSGGVTGQQYTVSCEITTSQGRTDVRSFTVQVQIT